MKTAVRPLAALTPLATLLLAGSLLCTAGLARAQAAGLDADGRPVTEEGPSSAKQRMRDRMADWDNMTPQQKREARDAYKRARELPPEEREARWRAYQSMSPEQRQAWAERARPPGRSAPPALPYDPPSGRDDRGPRNSLADPGGPGAREGIRRPPPLLDDRGNPGTTRNLPNRPPAPPLHQQGSSPKINAAPGYVDRATLLPQRGPQGAGAGRSGPPASGPSRKK